MKKIIRTVVLGSLLSLSATAFAFDFPEFDDNFVRQVTPKGPIPFVPFDYINPYTGKIESPSFQIELDAKDAEVWKKRFITLRDYYAELNQIEEQWNKIGYSLRKPQDIKTLKEILTDSTELVKQAESLVRSIRPFDEMIMTAQKSLDEQQAAFEKAVQERADSSFSDLFVESKAKFDAAFEPFADAKKDPDILQKPDKDLSNFIHKGWNLEKGDASSFLAKGSASIDVSGSLKKLEGLGEARVDIVAMTQLEINVLYMYLKASVLDDGSAQASTNVEVLGKVVDMLKTEKKGKVFSWRLSDDNSGDQKKKQPWEKVYRKGKEFPFSIGPIPAVAEVGASGRVYLDTGVNVDAKNYALGASLIPGVESSGYVNVGVGVPFAHIGPEANLVILNSELNLGVDIALNLPVDDKPANLDAGIHGTQTTRALAGKLSLVAVAKLPILGEKRYERKLFEWPGVSATGTLFDFRKIADRNGYSLKGAPTQDDIADVELDGSIDKFFNEAIAANRERVSTETLREEAVLTATRDATRSELMKFLGHEAN